MDLIFLYEVSLRKNWTKFGKKQQCGCKWKQSGVIFSPAFGTGNCGVGFPLLSTMFSVGVI